MSLSVNEALAHVEAELGMRGTMDPAWSGLTVLNRAGEHFVNAEPWHWLRGGLTRQNLIGGQDFVRLPNDVGRVTSLDGTSLNSGIVLTTPADLQRRKASQIGTLSVYYYAAVSWHNRAQRVDSITIVNGGTGYTSGDFTTDNEGTGGIGATARYTVTGGVITSTQVNTAGVGYRVVPRFTPDAGGTGFVGTVALQEQQSPTPVLDIYPTPEATSRDYFTVYYMRTWPHVTEDDTGGLLPIPDFCIPAFLEMVVAFARGYEESDMAGVSQRVALVEAGPVFRAAVKRDRGMQSDKGLLQGGAIQSNPYGLSRLLRNPVAGPS